MKTLLPVLLISVMSIAARSNLSAQVITKHSGATNPTSEGFSLSTYGNPLLGPVVNDQSINAWSTRMLSTDAAQYGHQLTPGEKALIAGADWTLTCTLKILQAPTTPSYDLSTAFYSGTEMFSLYFGLAANGNPIVQVRENSLLLSPVLEVAGGANAYNTFSLNYHAATDSADLWVNGMNLQSGMVAAPFITSQSSLLWNGYQHANTVEARWNLVAVTVPEPSAFCMVLLGGCMFVRTKMR
jgi:hypothetical protein